MIPQDTISKIFDAADIKDVVSDFVPLKKAGVNYTACCPFHDEKTPSFVVSPSKGIYKCFGCDASGGAINFVMEHQKITYPEALKLLAKKYSIEIKEEKPSPEREKIIKQSEQLYLINDIAINFFKSFDKIWEDKNTLALEYIQNRFSREEIIQWKIGFAPDSWDNLLNHFKSKNVKESFYLKSSLIKESKGKRFDCFRNRVIFPIFNRANRPIAFGGRLIPNIKNDKNAKYLNSSDTILYNKSNTLYGLNFAYRSISKNDHCFIVEGYTDVISLHSIDIIDTVAPCGTSLTINQLRLIKKYTNTITLLLDGDAAGRNASNRNAKLAIENGMNVYIAELPPGEDPDSFFKSNKDFKLWIKNNRKDYILSISEKYFKNAGGDPLLRHDSINFITKLLFNLDKTKMDVYIEQICKQTKVKSKLFYDKISDLNHENVKVERDDRLPEGVDPKSFEKWGFYTYYNEYYFRTKFGIEKLSNFTMKAVFHINSVYDSKRIYELINVHGYRVVVDLDMQEMTSLQGFQRNIESKGNFMFWGQMAQFQKLKLKLYEETRTCQEIKNLGWQKEGFWAWANGMINNEGNFIEIDEYGIVNHNEQDYFIPAFSKIFIKDKTIFLDERKFQYKKSKVNFEEWMKLFLKVHGDNAMIGFAWYIAALFRDHIFYLNDNFPLLNLFGQKGSGKNTLAYSLLSLFGKKQTEFNIHNGTKPGLAKHLEMFRNSIAFVDEYKNNLDFDKIETLKSIYNAIGRSRLNMDKGGKKETTEVNQSVIVAGQEMPTIDAALSSRTLFLQFLSKEGLSKEAKKNFEKLQEMERDGLPHFTFLILKHRKHFVEYYKENYDTAMKKLVEATTDEEINDRLLRNICTVISAFKTLESKFDFQFNYDQIFAKGLSVTRIHNKQIKQSDEIGVFWNLLEAMFDDNILIDKWHFNVKMMETLKTKQGEKSFPEGKRILRFKFNSIAKLYAEQLRRRNEKALPQDSLMHYLKTNKYFIGIERACKFTRKDFNKAEGKVIEQKQTTTAFCFDYEMLNINLEREAIEFYDNETTNPDSHIEPGLVKKKPDDLPF